MAMSGYHMGAASDSQEPTVNYGRGGYNVPPPNPPDDD